MRRLQHLTDEELTEEFNRLNGEAQRWFKRATEARNSGGMGMAYGKEYEETALGFVREAGQIITEMRLYRGHDWFGREHMKPVDEK